MDKQHFDVAVIGSGPGGCTAATFLAQKGYPVVMIERERFPRFHVGESLLSASQEIWERMGIAERLQHSGHTFKYGGGFRIGKSPNRSDFYSSTVFFGRLPKRDAGTRPFAYHVERAVFDKQLQDFAIEQGVTVWDRTAVEEVLFESTTHGNRATGLRLRGEDNSRREISADFIIDASGRRCLIGRQLGCVEQDTIIKTSAVFGHFRGVRREPGFKQGLFTGYFIENGWFWLIPLANDVMSVGLVQNEPATHDWSNNPEEVLLGAMSRYKFVRELFTDAVQVGRVRSTKALAYRTRQFCGDGWLSIGDANFFVDPLFSSGVHVAHSTGERAAEVVDEFLCRDRDMTVIRKYQRYIERYRRSVFGIIYSIYRLLKHYGTIRFFNWSAGRWGRDFDTWMLRRVAAWSAGYFDRHRLVMRITEWIGNTVARVLPLFTRLWGDDGWKRYERDPHRGPELQIPKQVENDRLLTSCGNGPALSNEAEDTSESPPLHHDVTMSSHHVVGSQ